MIIQVDTTGRRYQVGHFFRKRIFVNMSKPIYDSLVCCLEVTAGRLQEKLHSEVEPNQWGMTTRKQESLSSSGRLYKRVYPDLILFDFAEYSIFASTWWFFHFSLDESLWTIFVKLKQHCESTELDLQLFVKIFFILLKKSKMNVNSAH